MKMIDISKKKQTKREATAIAKVLVDKKTIQAIKENKIEKGDVISATQLVGIVGAKNTPNILPFCHPIPISNVKIDIKLLDEGVIEIRATVKATASTGVEMEAMTAASVAALNVYDMIKKIDRWARITDIMLLRKSGGKSGTLVRPDA